MVLKIDLHMHTSHSPDSLMSPEQVVRRCQEVGLACIAITDHNTILGAIEVQRIAPFRIIVGEEIRTLEGEIVGLFLKEDVPKGLSPIETAKHIKDQGGLISIPHPFDRLRRSVITRSGLEELRPYVDIIEGFNARNTFQAANKKAMDLAGNWGVLVSSVSDAHTTMELGYAYTDVPEWADTPESFKSALSQATLVTHPTTPLIHVLTTLTKGWKHFKR